MPLSYSGSARIPLPAQELPRRGHVAGDLLLERLHVREAPLVAQAGSRREPLLLEVHLFDVDEDLYGRLLRVEFVHRLRDERRFPNVEALKIQIGKDVQAARRLLAG